MSDDLALDPRKKADVSRVYENEAIRVTWEPKFCIHTARCMANAPLVFDAGVRPWIDLSGADVDTVAETVMLCPTGALHFERLDGGPQEPHPEQTIIEARTNGPLFVRGTFEVRTADGVRTETRAALCRCGGSANKPFCDNTHRTIGFRAEGQSTL